MREPTFFCLWLGVKIVPTNLSHVSQSIWNTYMLCLIVFGIWTNGSVALLVRGPILTAVYFDSPLAFFGAPVEAFEKNIDFRRLDWQFIYFLSCLRDICGGSSYRRRRLGSITYGLFVFGQVVPAFAFEHAVPVVPIKFWHDLVLPWTYHCRCDCRGNAVTMHVSPNYVVSCSSF